MKKGLLITSALCLTVAANAQWTNKATGFTTASRGIQDVEVVDANTVWAVAYDGSGANATIQEFTRTLNGGATWTPGTIAGVPTLGIANISAINGDTAWACLFPTSAATGGIYKTTNGGGAWTKQTTATFTGTAAFPDFVHFFNASNGVAVGDPNGGFYEIYTTTDGGTNWVRTPSANIPAPLAGEFAFINDFDVEGNAVWFGTGSDVAMGGNGGRCYKSVNGGLNWTVSVVQPTNYNVSDVVFSGDATNGLAQCNLGVAPFTQVLRKTIDGGATWTTVTPVGQFFITDLENIPGSSVYVSTGAGGTSQNGSSYSVDGGITWLTIDTLEQRTAQGWFSGSIGWAGGFNLDAFTDGIFKYNNGTVGIQALNREDARIRVFPNPSGGTFTVQIAGAEKSNATVTIADIVGNTVYVRTIANSASVIEQSMDLSGIAKGVYFVTVQNGATFFIDKLIME